MTNPFKPSVALLVKLGSLIVHYSEMDSPTGNRTFDLPAIAALQNDQEVQEWFSAMHKLALLPVKR